MSAFDISALAGMLEQTAELEESHSGSGTGSGTGSALKIITPGSMVPASAVTTNDAKAEPKAPTPVAFRRVFRRAPPLLSCRVDLAAGGNVLESGGCSAVSCGSHSATLFVMQ